MREENMLLEEIQELLQNPPAGATAPTLARVEDTLTAGYARALALEAERWRLERAVGEIARAKDVAAHAEELTALARKISRTDGRLANLRAVLAPLKERAAQIRASSTLVA